MTNSTTGPVRPDSVVSDSAVPASTAPAEPATPQDRAELDDALICLNLLTEPGDRRIAARVRRSGAVTALAQLRLELSITASRIAADPQVIHPRDAVERAAELGITAITLGSDHYPPALLDLAEPPLVLWATGELRLLTDLPRRAYW